MKMAIANATIAEVTSLVTKGTTPTTLGRPFTTEGIGFIKAECISSDGALITEKQVYIDGDTDQLLKRSRLQKDDVLFSIAGVIGRTALVQQDALPANTNQAIAILRPDTSKIIPRFLYYTVRAKDFQDHSLGHIVQTAQANVSLGVLSAAPIWLPSLPTQHRIAGILSAYDDLIENSQRRIKILESIALALYREWFVHFRFPGHESVPLVSSALGAIPQGWEARKLSNLITYNRRATKPGPHLQDRQYVPIDCLPPKSLALLEAKPIIEAQSSLQLFEKGDILFGAMRPYFHKVVVAPFPGVTRTTCFVFKPVRPEWHAFATMTAFDEATVAYANAHSQGATIPYAVWDGSLSEMPVVLPSSAVIQRYESVAAPILAQLAQSFFTLGNLRRTRDLLLPRLLSGQIDVEAMSA
jgi:type I restriction enzyme S subunit